MKCPPDCPWPDDKDIHVPWCREISDHTCSGPPTHQHYPKKGIGGNPDGKRSKIVAIICGSIHDLIDNGTTLRNDVRTHTTSAGKTLRYYRIYNPATTHREDGWALLWKEIPSPLSKAARPEQAPVRNLQTMCTEEASPPTPPTLEGLLTPKGLRQLPVMDIEEYLVLGRTIGLMRQGIQWAIGDFLIAGEQQYGEMYAQAIDLFDLSYDRLKNYVYVCRAFPTEKSRQRDCSFSVYEEFAPVANKDPVRAEQLLAIAEAAGATRTEAKHIKSTEYEDTLPKPATWLVCPACGHTDERSEFRKEIR